MELDQLGKPISLNDWAYDAIKQAILKLQFAPTTQLHVDQLADELRISRTPIRDALLRLEKDGLVHAVPRVGFFVSEITKRDLRELFELRELLESYACRKAATSLSDGDLEYATNLLRESRSAADSEDLGKFLQTEIEFHSFLIERAGNHWLAAMMESVRDLTYRERILSLKSLDNIHQSCSEHLAILDALRQSNAELAGELMAAHIRSARDRVMAFADLPDDKHGR
jgi:DNA-binding GntR family transcriptional regulator